MGAPSVLSFARAAVLLLLLGGTGFGPCTNQDELHAVEAKRDALLASTRPKSEFWPEVERKGRAVKAEQAAAQELAKQKAQNEALAQEVAAAERSAADRQGQRAAAESALAAAKTELEAARAEGAKRDETLAGFASRQRARGPS